MKTIGMVGGLSWESSVEYYRIINQKVNERLGGFHSARSVMVSVDFADIEVLQREGRWEEAGRRMAAAALQVQQGGADFVLLCCNTMYKSADAIQAAISIPFLHIADATAERVKQAGISRVGLLGTRFTMEEDFIQGRLAANHGLQVLIPEPPDRERVHQVIYDELVRGKIEPASREDFRAVIRRLVAAGAQGIILGCTEIGLLVGPEDSPVPLFDTTRIHAEAAVDWALG